MLPYFIAFIIGGLIFKKIKQRKAEKEYEWLRKYVKTITNSQE